MDFKEATELVGKLKDKLDNDTLLKLYGFFKQATIGDINITRPWPWQVKECSKYDAWLSVKGMKQSDAEEEYISIVKELNK